MKPILCVDFDGVLHDYSSGWQGLAVISDGPTPGAMRWLLRALEHWEIYIYSTRSKDPEARKAMQEWTEKHAEAELTTEEATTLLNGLWFAYEKPMAFLTIDDRCICFQGDWSKLDPQELRKFKSWNKREFLTT